MKLILVIGFILGAITCRAQLGETKPAIIAEKGYNYEDMTANDGTPFIIYTVSGHSAVSGDYKSFTAYYFKNGVCGKMIIMEPVGEINAWIKSLNRDYVNDGGFTWIDYATNRKITVTKDSLIVSIETMALK